jgi:enterochelin esterase-like enzyme
MGIQGGSKAPVNAIAGSGSAGTPEEFVKANAAFFADSKKTNAMVKLFFVGVGKDDNIVANGPKQLSDTLTAHGIRNEYHEIDGGHSMTSARLLMLEFVQKLFR